MAKPKDIRPVSCPNCGGPVNGSHCPYCDSLFWDVADIELNKPAYIRFRYKERTMICKAIPYAVDIHMESSPEMVYADNTAYAVIENDPDIRMKLEFFLQTHGKNKEKMRVVEDWAPEREKYINLQDQEEL